MKLNARVTTLSFFAATALGAATFAFAGCTVTSGTTTGDGGPPINPGDGGGDAGSDAPATCEGNKQTTKVLTPDCQTCLNARCCTELKGCFNVNPGKDDAGADLLSCDTYTECVVDCFTNPGDAGTAAQCQCEICEGRIFNAGTGQCDRTAPPIGTTQEIIEGYDSLLACGKAQGCGGVCGID